MAKLESWLKRNIVGIVAASIAAVGVGVLWYNGSKTPAASPVQPPPMTAIASGGGTAINATQNASVNVGPSAAGQAGSQTYMPTPAGAQGAMHASADTGGTAVNATGSAQVTVQKPAPEGKP